MAKSTTVDKKISDFDDLSSLKDTDYFLVERDNKFYRSEAKNIENKLFKFKKTITTSQIKNLNSSPIELIEAPGKDRAIEMVTAAVKMEFNSAAYVTNTDLDITTDTADEPQMSEDVILTSTADRITRFVQHTPTGTSNSQLVKNKAVQLEEPTGDPATGDSNIVVYGTYRIISL